MSEALEQLIDLDKKSEHNGTALAIVKYIVAMFLVISSTYVAYLQSNMATKFEVLTERLNSTNKQLEENRIFVQKLVLDLHAVELAVKELQFNEKMKRTKK